MFQAVVNQLAHDPVQDHFDIHIETFRPQVRRKIDPHRAARQPIDEIRDRPR